MRSLILKGNLTNILVTISKENDGEFEDPTKVIKAEFCDAIVAKYKMFASMETLFLCERRQERVSCFNCPLRRSQKGIYRYWCDS